MLVLQLLALEDEAVVLAVKGEVGLRLVGSGLGLDHGLLPLPP